MMYCIFFRKCFFSKVYIVDMKKHLFDHEHGNKLLFYYKDFENAMTVNVLKLKMQLKI